LAIAVDGSGGCGCELALMLVLVLVLLLVLVLAPHSATPGEYLLSSCTVVFPVKVMSALAVAGSPHAVP